MMKFRLGDLCLSFAVAALAVSASSPVFARSQQSLGDLDMSADKVADWYPVENLPLDTSSWNLINVTSSANASSVGCSPAVPNDAGDDGTAIACMLRNAPDQSIIYLPEGEYSCQTSSGAETCLTMSSGERVLRGDGAGRTIITSTRSDMLIRTDNWSSKAHGPSVAWTGGFTRGTQVLTVSSSSAFQDGDWVLLLANADPEIDGGEGSLNVLSYGVKVTCSGGSGSDCTGTAAGQIRVDRPLRTDFTSGGQRVEDWNPYVHWGIENLTMRYANNAEGVAQNRSGTRLNESAESWIVGVEFENADNEMLGLFQTARMKISGNEFGLLARRDAWQKTAVKISQTHDSEIVNNVWTNSHVAFQIGAISSGNIFAYNRMYRPTAPGYQWCERSFFIHGGSAIEFLVEGNDFECGLQWDGLQGPAGHRVALYRNRGRVTGTNYHAGTGGGGVANADGSFVYHADVPGTEPWFTRLGWSAQARIKDWLVAGNNVSRMGLPYNFNGWGINANGSGMTFEHNVIRDGCSVEGAPSIGATSCADSEPLDLSRLPRAAGTIWTDNPVGANSAPGSWDNFDFPDSLVYVDTPDWWCSESGSFPNIGAPSDNFGSVSSLSRLPAQIRNEGGACTRGTGPATFPAPILLP